MFRRRLSLVLILLAATVVLQGVAAVFALHEAERQVVRGRIASDIHQGFVQLLATKQRLRSWVTQHKIGAGGDPDERTALLRKMQKTLADLVALANAAEAAGLGSADASEHPARIDALRVLGQSVETLGSAVGQLSTLPPDAPVRQGWDALSELFDRAEGQDLRELISRSIAREAAAMQRERTAADVTLARIGTLWIGMALVLALLALGATLYFARALRRPIDALVAGAQRLRQGHLEHRVPLDGHDEFSDVARSMNAMAEALEKHGQRESRQRHQLEEQVRERTGALQDANVALQRTDVRRRQLLADISHELRTPTTAIRGEAEVTLRGPDRPAAEYREALQRIVDTSRQLGSVIDDLLAMARSDMESLSLAREPVDLADPLREALYQASALAGGNYITIKCAPIERGILVVKGDAQRLAQLFLLLLDNAVRYSHRGGRVYVDWALSADQPGMVEVAVTDQGIGIPKDELPQVFDRHFRGSAARLHRAAGSGLGLPIARTLAAAHEGSVELQSPASNDPRPGTRAVLRLPLIQGGGQAA
ncbi:MAG: HAMP domain-containing histidine kinase [Burkholderiales bacterium]|jgi:two-component system, OmpR family, sensor kinase|nr:HAMP domain-containing histidine kinase [Burkholderiales bacterium]